MTSKRLEITALAVCVVVSVTAPIAGALAWAAFLATLGT